MNKLLGILCLFFCLQSLADFDAEERLSKFYPESSIEIIKIFETSEDGYVGVIVIVDGTKGIIYFSKETGVGFVGTLFSPNGKNLTLGHVRENLSFFEDVVGKDIEEGRGSDVQSGFLDDLPLLSIIGKRDNNVFVVYDPLCSYCVQYDQDVRKLNKDLRNKISWIPVSIMKSITDSALLGAGDLDRKEAFSGGSSDNTGSLLRIAQNTRTIKKHVELKTPTIIHLSEGKVEFLVGLPISKLTDLLDD